MKTSHALTIFTHLIALTGFISVSITGEVDGLSIVVFTVSLILSFFNEWSGKRYYLSNRVLSVLAIILLIFVLANTTLFGMEIFSGILVFLIYTQVLKLLGSKELRDIVQIYILSFFQFLAGTILTVSFSYGIVFIVYVALSIWAIITFNMQRESIEARSYDDPKVVTPLFLGITGVASFGIFFFTAFLFVSVPRLGSGFFTSNFLKPAELSTGFSDQVKLGQVGQIKLDTTPIMRIKILDRDPETLPKPIYWRGIALDEFDGKEWRVGDLNQNVYKKNKDGIILVNETKNKTLSQEIVTEPLDTDILFAANLPVGFWGVAGGKIEEVNDSYIIPGQVSYRLKYLAYSDLSIPSAEELRREKEDYPNYIKNLYLKLPPLSERVQELAKNIISTDVNSYDKANSIKRYLINNMNYTITLEKGASEFPLDDFLFDNKAGHCEYFATAMVVLLREVGIPARIVNGFLDGEWNQYGRFFLVRQSNAHSWVEVFFSGHGWILFDPTPASDEGFPKSNFIATYLDYLRYRWSRYIVDFSQRDQINLFSGLQNRWRWQKSKFQNKLEINLKFNKKWLLGFVILALVVWTFLANKKFEFLRIYERKKPEEKASIIYKKALKLLSKKGFKKPDFVTPREFVRDLINRGGTKFQTFERVTEKYVDLRFGRDIREPRSNEDTKPRFEELEKLLNRLKNEIK